MGINILQSVEAAGSSVLGFANNVTLGPCTPGSTLIAFIRITGHSGDYDEAHGPQAISVGDDVNGAWAGDPWGVEYTFDQTPVRFHFTRVVQYVLGNSLAGSPTVSYSLPGGFLKDGDALWVLELMSDSGGSISGVGGVPAVVLAPGEGGDGIVAASDPGATGDPAMAIALATVVSDLANASPDDFPSPGPDAGSMFGASQAGWALDGIHPQAILAYESYAAETDFDGNFAATAKTGHGSDAFIIFGMLLVDWHAPPAPRSFVQSFSG